MLSYITPPCWLRALRTLGLLVPSLLASTGLFAQQLNHSEPLSQNMLDVWMQDRGLPQNGVHDIVQTNEGFLWMATYQGLARFDGIDFQAFTIANAPELRSNGILQLEQAADGTLWIGTNGGGLAYLRNGRFGHIASADELATSTILRMELGPDGQLWAGTQRGLFMLRGDSLVRSVPPAADTLFDVRALCIAPDGQVYLGSETGVYGWSPQGYVPYLSEQAISGLSPELRDALSKYPIYCLLHAVDGSLWVGTATHGLLQLRGGALVAHYGAHNGIQSNAIESLYQDKQGALWIGTRRGGLHRLWQGELSPLNQTHGLEDNDIRCVYEDREGSIWVGTYRGGAARLKARVFNYYQPVGQDLSQPIHCLIHHSNGSIWIGTANQGLLYIAPNGQQQWLSPPGTTVRSLYEHTDGTVWAGTWGGGVSVFRGPQRVATYSTELGTLPNNFIRQFISDGQGGMLLATDEGIVQYSGGRFSQYLPNTMLPNMAILSMEFDAQGRLWAGTDGQGLICVHQGAIVQQITQEKGLSSNIVLDVHIQQDDGVLWVGTNNGFDRVALATGDIFTFNEADGMVPSGVLHIVPDLLGSFWLSSNAGFYRIHLDELEDFRLGRSSAIDGQHYTRDDGLRRPETASGSHPAYHVEPTTGEVWIASQAGIARIQPQKLLTNDLPPPLAFIRLLANGEQLPQASLSSSQRINLIPETRKLEIHFAALSFKAPQKNRYRYILEGYDKQWTEIEGRRFASYTNLPPGNYTFKVEASNNNGVWNEAGASLLLRREPFFYETTGFKVAIPLVLALFIFIGVRTRDYQQKRHRRMLEVQIERATNHIGRQKEQLEDQNELLNDQNRKLEEQTEELRETIDVLTATQDRLQQSEKMAILGQLMASIGHEIKTPLAVTVSSAKNNEQLIPQLLGTLPRTLRVLDEQTLELVISLVAEALQTPRMLSTREERMKRLELEEEMRSWGLSQPEELARQLILMNYYGKLAPYRALLSMPTALPILEQACFFTELKRNNAAIISAAERTHRVTKAMQSYSYNKPSGNKEAVDIAQSLDNVLTLYEHQLRQGIELVREYASLPPVAVYADEIEHVWGNLIQNAIQAMQEGHTSSNGSLIGKLTLRTEQVTDGVHVHIQDSGKGIPQEMQRKIFDTFFTTRPKGKGTGLGLDLVKRIIEHHEGEITLASQPGNTCFTVYLPLG